MKKLTSVFSIKKRIELWWFYLSEEEKRVLRFTGTIMLQLFAFIFMMAFVVLLPYLIILIANYFNIDI